MAYIAEERFKIVFTEKEFLNLTDFNNDGIPDPNVFETAVAKADAMINDSLRIFYVVPFATPVPETILTIAESLVRYYLYSKSPNKDVNEKFEVAMTTIQNIKNGHVRLEAEKTESTVIVDDYEESSPGLQNVYRVLKG